MSPTAITLKAELQQNLNDLGFTELTPVQQASLPLILANRDLIAQAQTGSGKTAAFALGMLQLLDVKRFRIQSLVLCPTRELADQVATEIRKLGRAIHNIKVLTLCGGVPFGPQLGSLEHGAHIIVGTPGRIEEHLQKGSLQLQDLNLLVLDEADRMLEMGFAPSLDAIVQQTPKNRQTLLFSATFPRQIEQLASRYLTEPARVQIETADNKPAIDQQFHAISNNDRFMAVELLLKQHQPVSAVLFCNQKRECHDLWQYLVDQGFSALALHGDLEQRDRDLTLIRFSNQSCNVLVATDVAARGLDIQGLDLVVNVQLAHDTETHVHRIGRTGRAGASGLAVSLVTPADDYKRALLADLYPAAEQLLALPDASLLQRAPRTPAMAAIWIDGGKKHKVRAGDIVGALTVDQQIEGNQIGKIQVTELHSYVAVPAHQAKHALKLISAGIKGRNFRCRIC